MYTPWCEYTQEWNGVGPRAVKIEPEVWKERAREDRRSKGRATRKLRWMFTRILLDEAAFHVPPFWPLAFLPLAKVGREWISYWDIRLAAFSSHRGWVFFFFFVGGYSHPHLCNESLAPKLRTAWIIDLRIAYPRLGENEIKIQMVMWKKEKLFYSFLKRNVPKRTIIGCIPRTLSKLLMQSTLGSATLTLFVYESPISCIFEEEKTRLNEHLPIFSTRDCPLPCDLTYSRRVSQREFEKGMFFCFSFLSPPSRYRPRSWEFFLSPTLRRERREEGAAASKEDLEIGGSLSAWRWLWCQEAEEEAKMRRPKKDGEEEAESKRRVGGLTVQNSPREDAQFEPKFKLQAFWIIFIFRKSQSGERNPRRNISWKTFELKSSVKRGKVLFPLGDKSSRPIWTFVLLKYAPHPNPVKSWARSRERELINGHSNRQKYETGSIFLCFIFAECSRTLSWKLFTMQWIGVINKSRENFVSVGEKIVAKVICEMDSVPLFAICPR